MQDTIEANNQEMKTNNQDSDEKMMKLTEDFKAMLASTIKSIMDQINTLESSPTQKDSPKPTDCTNMALYNKRASPLDIGQSTKNGGM